MNIISGSKFDIVASNFCGSNVYPVKNNTLGIEEFKALIPDNIFDLSREELAPIVKSVMESMNIFWSSTGEIATFPEKFGEHTKLAIRPDSIYMSGRGWSVTVYRGRYDVIKLETANNLIKIIDNTNMTDEEMSSAITKICGPASTPIG